MNTAVISVFGCACVLGCASIFSGNSFKDRHSAEERTKQQIASTKNQAVACI